MEMCLYIEKFSRRRIQLNLFVLTAASCVSSNLTYERPTVPLLSILILPVDGDGMGARNTWRSCQTRTFYCDIPPPHLPVHF